MRHIYVGPRGSSLLQQENDVVAVTLHHSILGYHKHVVHLLFHDYAHVHSVYQGIAGTFQLCFYLHQSLVIHQWVYLCHRSFAGDAVLYERTHHHLLPDAHM